MLEVHRWIQFRNGKVALALSVVMVGALLAPSVHAEPTRFAERCSIFTMPDQGNDVRILAARCGERGLILGQTTDYKSVFNDGTGTVVVDKRLGDERSVLLLSFGEDGVPFIENINADIAAGIGLAPASGIERVDLSFEGFAENGEITVRAQASEEGIKRLTINPGSGRRQ